MQSQDQRDAKTLVIMTGVGLFVLVVALGAVVLWATQVILGLSDDAMSDGFALLCAFAAIPLVGHIWRESLRRGR